MASPFAKAALGKLPADPHFLEEPATEHDEYDSTSSSSVSSTGTILAPPTSRRPVAASPLSWTNFFDQELYLESKEESWSAKYHVYFDPPKSAKDAVIVLHHGAGSSALSWAYCAKDLRQQLPSCGILAVEAREHGSVVWDANNDSDTDLSIDLLSHDLARMVQLTKEKVGWTELPRLLLIGHSLGGAVVTHTAKLGLLGNKVIGFGVIDVVEGSALEALQHMKAYLATRPQVFNSPSDAVEWTVRSRVVRNHQSAQISVPDLLKRVESGRWVWRTDLTKTEDYWENWFNGMSNKFLASKGAKLLILAGTDRLDKELMIGQMQGKFQLHVVPEAGHFVQEDTPPKTATMIADFFRRNDQSALVLPPKVSDLLAAGKKV